MAQGSAEERGMNREDIVGEGFSRAHAIDEAVRRVIGRYSPRAVIADGDYILDRFTGGGQRWHRLDYFIPQIRDEFRKIMSEVA
jgi:hypothetical protein